jgi:chromosome segregation protein
VRLTEIKLAGFKSFVDPTTIGTPGQLVGIVGPNGCGKSNVIDAVRWVLGESKASALRGESMHDVIFNGAGERKPVGRASVELRFDNSQGRVGGQWGQFAELSIRRVLTRDGDSSYYINNLPVRRRDIHDLFLGTGLGPRAYAIIEQGMISRVIESKPEELRVFLEEAAGVSKYKERRKETESRLADTRKNLARVEDIRIELGVQLEKLEAQAKVAAEFRDLEARLKTTQQLLWHSKQQDAARSRERQSAEIATLTVAFEGLQAELRSAEAKLETLRNDRYGAGDALSERQGEFYAANAEVTRLEQQLAFARESESRLTAQVAQLTEQLAGLGAQGSALAADRSAAETAVETALTAREAAEQAEQAASGGVPALESAVADGAARMTELQDVIAATEQAIRVAETHRDNSQRVIAGSCRTQAAAQRRAWGTGASGHRHAARDRRPARRRDRRAHREGNLAPHAARVGSGAAGAPARRERHRAAGAAQPFRARGTSECARRVAGAHRPRQGQLRLARAPGLEGRTRAYGRRSTSSAAGKTRSKRCCANG